MTDAAKTRSGKAEKIAGDRTRIRTENRIKETLGIIKRLKILDSVIIFALSIFVLMNAAVIIANLDFNYYYDMPLPDADTRILVVASHQDDETLIAGDYMIRTMQNGGEVFVIYTVDGATRENHFSDEDILSIIETRELEVRDALGLIGIGEDNSTREDHIIFLRNENRKALMDAALLDDTIDKIGQEILDIGPDMIFIPSYEGGHCDHDMTNFAVMTALDRYDIDDVMVYEGAEYNGYLSAAEYMLNVIDRFTIVKFKVVPRFVNFRDDKIFRLNVSEGDLSLKQSMLDAFVSQDIDLRIVEHNRADIYRLVPSYDYSMPPYYHEKTLKYKVCVLRGMSGCDLPNICRISFDDMNATVQEVYNLHQAE